MAQFQLELVCFAVVFLSSITECRVCTRIVAEQKTQTYSFPGECINTYERRCGWFSVKICIFNETVQCMKEMNQTIGIYRVVEDCCPGYAKDSEGHCMSIKAQSKRPETGNTAPYDTESDQDHLQNNVRSDTVDLVPFEEQAETGQSLNSDDDDEGKLLNISHGAYAGIVCGVLFVVCVALLTALHYRKRHVKQEKMNTINMEQEVAQKQAMIPLDTMENTENSSTTPINT